jgi:ubiquinone/menaquinone biosynthesis C-methylase UbiE
MDARILELWSFPAHPMVATEEVRLVDAQRLTAVIRQVKGDSVLDVGSGAGFLAKALRCDGKKVVEVDIHPKGDAMKASVLDLPFPENAFDTVTCLEVLEHLSPTDTTKAVSELRRVAKDRLIVTVPYSEPTPLPSYHKNRFCSSAIEGLFPKATYTLLFKPIHGTHWIMIEEDSP